MGHPMKKARNHLGDHPLFNALRRRIMLGRRKAEEARNLATAIKIRDDEGDESAATKTVRLKAIQVIEAPERQGKRRCEREPADERSTPGYVIRLPALKPDRDVIEP
jgi:hypothetical protein